MGTGDFTPGRKSYDYIVMHWGVTSSIEQIDREVLNPNRQMSYHYALCGLEGVIRQYVDEANTAWHASNWDANQRSIGICINAAPFNPYNDEDYELAAQLCAAVITRHPEISVDNIKGHRDFKATECPGNLYFGRLRARVSEILNPAPIVEPTTEPVVIPEPVIELTPVVEPAPIPEPIPEPTPEPEFRSYTVVAGDSLTNIAAREYGLDKASGNAFRKALEIAKFNGIENPNLIFPGQVIKLP